MFSFMFADSCRGFIHTALVFQSWAGAIPVMFGASAVSCLNTMWGLLCSR